MLVNRKAKIIVSWAKKTDNLNSEPLKLSHLTPAIPFSSKKRGYYCTPTVQYVKQKQYGSSCEVLKFYIQRTNTQNGVMFAIYVSVIIGIEIPLNHRN